MFRPTRKPKKEISEQECIELLNTGKRGVLAVNGDDGYPYTVPINFYYDQDDQAIYFHGSMAGHKIDSIKKDDKVCFTTYGNDYKKEGDWAYYVSSVIIFGRAELVTDLKVAREKLEKLAMKFYPTKEEIAFEMGRDFHRVQMVKVNVEHMTGKLVHEK